MDSLPKNSPKRPNWYKIRLPRHLTKWSIDCLKEHVDLDKYQEFRKVSISCKNNGKTVFARILFESKLYYGGAIRGEDNKLTGLPVSYLFEVNKGILKGNSMDYDIGEGKKYNDEFKVFDKTLKLDEDSKFNKEKYILFNYIDGFTIPLVNTKSKPKRK